MDLPKRQQVHDAPTLCVALHSSDCKWGLQQRMAVLHLQRLQSRTSLPSTQSESGEAQGPDRAGLLPDVDQASLYASWAEAALLCLR